MTQIKDLGTTKTLLDKTDYLVGQTAAGGTNSTFRATYSTVKHAGRTTKTVYASKYTTESGDQTANLLSSWNDVLAVSGRVQWVVDPGTYVLTSPRNLFQLRNNVEIVLDGVEFTVDSGVSTSGWDLSATDIYSFDNGIFYYATPAVSDIRVYGGIFTIGAEELSPFQIGDSLTHTTGSVTDGNIRLIGLRQVGGNVVQLLSLEDVLVEELYQEGTHSTGLNVSNSRLVKLKSTSGKRIGVTSDFVTWNNVGAIVGKGCQDLHIESPRYEYTGGTSILIRASSTKPLLRIKTTDLGLSSCGRSGIEYQVGTDAAASSANEQLSINGGFIKGYQCSPSDTNHSGAQIAIAKTGGATVRGALIANLQIDYVSPDESFNESTHVLTGSYNTLKNTAAGDVGTTYAIQLSGVDASSLIYNGQIQNNGITHAKTSSILADHMAGGAVQGNVIEWGGWSRSGSPLIPLTPAHGIYANVTAELDISQNVIRNNNPSSVGSGSVRTQLIRCMDSYDTHVHDNTLRGNDTTDPATQWNYAPIGFSGSSFTLTGYTGRSCSVHVGRNNIYGTYLGLSNEDGSHVHRAGGSLGLLRVYDDGFKIANDDLTQTILEGVTWVLCTRTSGTQEITLPDPNYIHGQKVTIKHAGLGTGTVTILTAAGTLWPASPTLTNTGEYGTWIASGSVWERIG